MLLTISSFCNAGFYDFNDLTNSAYHNPLNTYVTYKTIENFSTASKRHNVPASQTIQDKINVLQDSLKQLETAPINTTCNCNRCNHIRNRINNEQHSCGSMKSIVWIIIFILVVMVVCTAFGIEIIIDGCWERKLFHPKYTRNTSFTSLESIPDDLTIAHKKCDQVEKSWQQKHDKYTAVERCVEHNVCPICSSPLVVTDTCTKSCTKCTFKGFFDDDNDVGQ